jgi:alpha-L-glutamate ligase-like protein/uncharacterized protein (TIGR02421 family)
MIFPFREHGILGLNARNLLYIKPFNPRKAVAFADDKMKTKAFLSARGIPTAKMYARIESRRQLKQFDFQVLPDRCVLKPNYGFGGEGIVILNGRKNGVFLEQGKRPMTHEELVEHIEDILDGKFSVNGRYDTAFFEQILLADECFAPFRPAGLPDIRIIVFNLVPVMAMLRIPTAESSGKANVHLGGLGIGIDVAKGITTHAAQYHKILTELPHGLPVQGITIPRWEELLLIASRIQHMTNIGYIAVDLTLDQDLGPVLLEVNARAGLMVQVANLAPLRARLERVEGLKVSSPEKGVRIAQELFGEKIIRDKGKHAEVPRIGTHETIEITGDGCSIEEACLISVQQEGTVFSPDLVQELAHQGALDSVKDSSHMYKVKFTLAGKKIQTLVHSGDTPTGVRVVIGRRDLQGLLIDPMKRSLPASLKHGMKKDLRAVDKFLCALDRELPLLRELRPLNLREERARVENDERYNPIFLQRECPAINEVERSLKTLDSDESPFGILLRKKKRELLLRLDLLRARGDAMQFTLASLALFGSPSPALIGFASSHLKTRSACELSPEQSDLLSAEKAKDKFEEVLSLYGLHDWQVELRKAIISDCAVGEKRIFLRADALFSPMNLQALFAHEIETHVLTAENGAAQPFELFRRGFANYLDTQEGLAIFNQYRVLPPSHEKRFAHAKNVLAVAFAMEHSFADTRKYLQNELGMSPERAITKAMDLKRGLSRTEEPGAFTKSLVYFRGFRAIEQFAREGGDLKRLYIGKIAIEDLPLIERMEGIRPALILPAFLRDKTQANTQRKPKKR